MRNLIKQKKYKLLKGENVVCPDGLTRRLHRIQALQDIPRHGVKAGDIGGYVEKNSMIKFAPHAGGWWIGGDAIVLASKKVLDEGSYNEVDNERFYTVHSDSLITDKAFIINSRIGGASIIRGNAYVTTSIIGKFAEDDTIVEGDSKLNRTKITNSKKSIISGNAMIESSSLEGTFTVEDDVHISVGSRISGISSITGTAVIPPGYRAIDIVISSGVASYSGNLVTPSGIQNGGSNNAFASVSGVETIRSIEEEYKSYTTDIVKLIKYPAMANASIPEVKDLIVCLRKANRAITSGNPESINECVDLLDNAFVVAENKVQTLSQSHLDEGKRKSLKAAKQMFAIAENTGATENERKVSFKAGFKELEGILPVTDEVISAFQVKTGLLEIEA